MLYPKRGFQCLEFYLYNSGSENNQLKIYTREYTAGHPDGVLTLQREIQGTVSTVSVWMQVRPLQLLWLLATEQGVKISTFNRAYLSYL